MPNVAIRGVLARLCLGLAEMQPDAELLENYIATRDEAAFASLVQRHGPKVFAVCRRLLGQHQLAEDAYQATFVVLAKKAHTIQPRSAVGGFLYGVARKAALEAYAVSRRRKETLVETVPDSPVASLAATDSDVLAMLDEEIANLSDTYRAAVVLCELDGVGRAEAAQQLGIAEGTLSSRLAAARKQLATRLKARGVVYSAGLMSSLAISANAAIPPTITSATTAVSIIATGVLRTMLLAKFKLVTTACVLVTAIIGMSTFVPKTSMEAKAAPVPKVEKEDGLLWTQDAKTGTLTAFTLDGKKEREIKLKAGRNFKGFSADGETLLFLAKKGQLTEEEDGLTLHLGKPGDLAGAIDTGIEYQANDGYLLTRDKKRIVRNELIQVGIVLNQNDKPNAEEKPMLFRHTMIDLASKKVTAIVLLDSVQIQAESVDGKEWITMHYNLASDRKLPGYRHLRIPVNGGKPIPICDTHQLPFFVPSPDGQTYLGLGVSLPIKGELKGFSLYHLNATGKPTLIEQFEGTDQWNLHWSPDGKQYAIKKHGNADVIVADVNGKNRKTLLTIPDAGPQTHLIGWFAAKQKISAPVPKVEKDEGLVWTRDTKTGTLTAFTIDGKKEREIKLKARRNFQSFSADGETLLFLARKGQMTEEEDGLTLHLGKPSDLAGAIDTGIERSAKDHFYFLLTRDKKRVVRVQNVRPGPAPPVNRVLPSFTHTLIDLATKKETAIKLTEHMQIWDETHDGKEWIVEEYNSGEDLKRPSNRYLRIPVNGGKPIPICDTHQFPFFVPSPDGQSYLGIGVSLPLKGELKGLTLYHFNPKTGKATERATFADTENRSVIWSPDGKRFAMIKHGDADLYIGDIDGTKLTKWFAIPDAGPETHLIGWFAAKQKISAPVPKVEFPKQPISAPVPKEREEVIVAYHAGRPVLLNANGKVVRELFAEGWGGSTGRAKLSKDGRQIAMLTDTKRDATGWMFRKLYVRDVDGKGNGEELMPEGLEALTAMWSPDGKSIYTSGFVTKKTIVDGNKNPNYANEAGIHHRIDIASKQRTELTLPAGHQIMDVSPDGKSFLTYVPHMHIAKETYKVCLVGMDGKVMDDLTDGSAPVIGQRFSPDGKKVVALSYNDVDNRTAVRLSEVFILDVAAKEKMVVLPLNGLHNDAMVQSVAWSPDGNRIAFSWWTDGRTKGEPKYTLAHVSIATLDDAKIRTIFSVKDKTLGSIDWAKMRLPEAVKP